VGSRKIASSRADRIVFLLAAWQACGYSCYNLRVVAPEPKIPELNASREGPYAVVLAGGGGTRLWPASRRSRPKQLLELGGSETLLGACLRRAWSLFGIDNTLVATASDQAAAIAEMFPAVPSANLVVEPSPRNTAAAIGLATAHVALRGGPEATIAVLPADAHVGDEVRFASALQGAVAAAREAIVTVGIRPSKPETGFGYIKVGRAIGEELFEVDRFVEKPDLRTAQEYLALGGYLWNSGMFFFTAGRYLREARQNLPELGSMLDEMLESSDHDSVVQKRYNSLPAISVDYAIIEKATGIRVVPAEFGWNDVGSWAAIDEMRSKDDGGNVTVGDVLVLGGQGNVVLSEKGAPFVGVVGVHDLVVVATCDAVLVIPKHRAQEVRQIVDALKAGGRLGLL
jgi:mannose-1-phosphate guanylyltransferase